MYRLPSDCMQGKLEAQSYDRAAWEGYSCQSDLLQLRWQCLLPCLLQQQSQCFIFISELCKLLIRAWATRVPPLLITV